MSKNLYLRAFETSDLNFINKLRNDDLLFASTGGNKYYISSERDKKWIEDKIFNNERQLYFMLSIDTNEPIGYVCALNIDYINRKAEWGGIILAREFINKGYGKEAGQLLLEHLFGQLGFNMVYGHIKEDNLASVKMAENIGFTKKGFIPDYIYKNYQYFGAHILSMTKTEYINKSFTQSVEKEAKI